MPQDPDSCHLTGKELFPDDERRWKQTTGQQARAAQLAVRTLLAYVGEDPDREGLRDTPRRVVKALLEMTLGNNLKAEDVLGTVFTKKRYNSMVVLRGISFESTCEHHLLPFTGHAHVAYLPSDKVVGLSKMARLVDMHAKRLQIQEQMTEDIAEDLMRVLAPKGTACVVVARHTCMECRGVRKAGAEMVTSHLTGDFMTDPATRAEFLRLAGL